jgi:hypothetical protein
MMIRADVVFFYRLWLSIIQLITKRLLVLHPLIHLLLLLPLLLMMMMLSLLRLKSRNESLNKQVYKYTSNTIEKKFIIKPVFVGSLLNETCASCLRDPLVKTPLYVNLISGDVQLIILKNKKTCFGFRCLFARFDLLERYKIRMSIWIISSMARRVTSFNLRSSDQMQL